MGEFNGMSSQSHVSHCWVLPLGEFTVTILEPHMPHCRVQSPDEINVVIVPHCGCKNSMRHIENRFSPYFILFCFQCSLGFDERRLSYLLRYTYYNTRCFTGSPHYVLLSVRLFVHLLSVTRGHATRRLKVVNRSHSGHRFTHRKCNLYVK